MISLIVLLLCCFSTYRLSLMFSVELGPCRIFEKFRGLFNKDGCWYKGVTCIQCETVWWSGVITAWLLFISAIPWQLSGIYWLGISGVAVIINHQWPQD